MQSTKPSISSSNNNKVNRRTFFNTAVATAAGIATSTITQSTTLPANANAAPTPTLPETGVKAPFFDLPNSKNDGSTTSLTTLTKDGKWTVLYFYPGAFTSGCTLEARGFQKDSSKYKSLNTQIVGVSVDSVEKNQKFCAEEQLDFYMLTDEKGIVSKAYGSSLSIPGFGTFSNRQTYLIDPQGNLRWVFTDVESHVARHSAEVLEKLNQLTTV